MQEAYFDYNSNIIFMENSSASFINNVATNAAGAIYLKQAVSIKLTQDSKVITQQKTMVEEYY